jgi:hypothetical protein
VATQPTRQPLAAGLRDGLWHHDVSLDASALAVAFYGDLFRHTAEEGRPDRAELEAVASASGFLDSIEDEFGPQGLEVLAGLLGRQALRTLVDQAARYFADENLRRTVRQRLAGVIGADTKVVVAHSMGTIVAYEALAEHPEWPVITLVTTGSPLGNDFVFNNLSPGPQRGLGAWPGSIATWANIAAVDDPVIDEPHLARRFGERVADITVDNGRDAHRAEPYLNAAATGAVIAQALRSGER